MIENVFELVEVMCKQVKISEAIYSLKSVDDSTDRDHIVAE